jgi:hypothetical protein
MIHALLHWLNTEYWGQSWPNIFAPSIYTLPAVVIAYFKSKQHRNKLHADLTQQVTAQHESLKQHVTDMIAKRLDKPKTTD